MSSGHTSLQAEREEGEEGEGGRKGREEEGEREGGKMKEGRKGGLGMFIQCCCYGEQSPISFSSSTK